MPIAAGLGSPEVPDWAPDREHVADYVPHRTLVRSTTSVTSSEDTYRFTWDQTTTPTGFSVDRLIGDGIAWVSAQVTPMNEASWNAARVCAVLYAAAAVERGWPEDDYALQRANDLEKRADTLLAALVISNDLANGGDGDPDDPDEGIAVVPLWSFPPADRRFDSSNYF